MTMSSSPASTDTSASIHRRARHRDPFCSICTASLWWVADLHLTGTRPRPGGVPNTNHGDRLAKAAAALAQQPLLPAGRPYPSRRSDTLGGPSRVRSHRKGSVATFARCLVRCCGGCGLAGALRSTRCPMQRSAVGNSCGHRGTVRGHGRHPEPRPHLAAGSISSSGSLCPSRWRCAASLQHDSRRRRAHLLPQRLFAGCSALLTTSQHGTAAARWRAAGTALQADVRLPLPVSRVRPAAVESGQYATRLHILASTRAAARKTWPRQRLNPARNANGAPGMAHEHEWLPKDYVWKAGPLNLPSKWDAVLQQLQSWNSTVLSSAVHDTVVVGDVCAAA
eukprot:ctg_2043.g412